MCGFAGHFYLTQQLSKPKEINVLKDMGEAIKHRGPDDHGYWSDQNAGIGLTHRRLSIIDLSFAGHQPMTSPSGRYVLVFNGEIYNHLDLRNKILEEGKQMNYLGFSDTETLSACFESWGVEKTLSLANGMFAFALWDKKNRDLTIARDRFGEKPLYYGWQGNGRRAVFLFGSELSSLRCHPSFIGTIDRQALAGYLKNNFVGGNSSIYNGISKLKPGSLIRVSKENTMQETISWFSSLDVARKGVTQRYKKTETEAVSDLEILLAASVKKQMISDVPLGAFLSGGVDSSTIVSLMQTQTSNQIKTFSIGFNESDFNEAKYANLVAKHLNTDHTELYVTAKQAVEVIPKLPQIYSEPFADSSQIPTFLVSQLASSSVKVCLSGDAGDELFSGYDRYRITSLFWNKIKICPMPLRKLLASVISSVSPKKWDYLGYLLSISRLGDKLHKGSMLLEHRSLDALYNDITTLWQETDKLIKDFDNCFDLRKSKKLLLEGSNDIEKMMLYDLIGYLPDDILTKVDRAAMSVGLETRIPFLDPDIVDFAWKLPIEYKLKNGITKWPVRQILYRYVPKKLIERPKMGFGVPLASWLRGPLRDWGESLITRARIKNDGFFKPELIEQKWNEHQLGIRNWQYQLWGILMFQAWLSEVN